MSWRSVQCFPSHVQVEPLPGLKRSVTVPLYASSAPTIGPGPVVATCVQAPLPNSHVSPTWPITSPLTISPPNKTIRCREVSYVAPQASLGLGPVSATWVHSVPSHSHVSLRNPPVTCPPKSTVRLRSLS